MIRIADEHLVPLSQVPKLLPEPRPHRNAVYRWAKHGVRGGVRLECIQIGGRRYTSVEALQRFSVRLQQAEEAPPQGLTESQRRVAAILDAKGF